MNKYSILVVDDEENVRNLLKKVLKKEGYNVYTGDSYEEALRVIDTADIDLVITDLRMPGLSGIELLKKIKEIDSFIKVVLITAYATVETAIEALKIGASDYILKPFDIYEIVDNIKKILDMQGRESINTIKDIKRDDNMEGFLNSKSSSMIKPIELIKKVADSSTSVLFYGETGTGKELAARTIHTLSSRNKGSFVKVNCAAIPDNLLESELFGYEKGAFTGASKDKPGRFELAQGGTIFLDEIGDISAMMQVKLLRVLQEREIEHLGGTKTIQVDVRIIAATNKDLKTLVDQCKFREDLYYRLNVVPITLPPLRNRRNDIEYLTDYFLTKAATISGMGKKAISKEALKKLQNYNWPGNIRELQNIVERCIVISEGETIVEEDIPDYIVLYEDTKMESKDSKTLEESIDTAEILAIKKVLMQCEGNRTKASAMLGISRRSLHRKLAKYNI